MIKKQAPQYKSHLKNDVEKKNKIENYMPYVPMC